MALAYALSIKYRNNMNIKYYLYYLHKKTKIENNNIINI